MCHNGAMLASSLQPETSSLPVNVADRLAAIAARYPDGVAVATPGGTDVAGDNSYSTCTFAELDRDATSLAQGFVELGVEPGTRLVLLVRPGIEFVKLVFALLRCGATTVLVDPGMGRRHLLRCLEATDPEGFVAISPAQAVRMVFRKRFPRARINVTVGRRWFWGGNTYQQLLEQGRASATQLPQTNAGDAAAIIFTSGSTGPPKGVLYTHEMFDAQAAEIQQHYDIQPGGVDMACFALFGLFNSAMGVTTVFPDMDFSRPASADPAKLLAAASDWRVTQAFASPAVWRKLSTYCQEQGEQIPTLAKVFSCGAPVPADVLRSTLACVGAGATMHTPYGATESLPVASIEAGEVLGETAERTDEGAGICVGRKFDTIDWQVIRITDDPIATMADAEEMPTGEIGELVVRGPQVSPAYVVGEEHNAAAKISGASYSSKAPSPNPSPADGGGGRPISNSESGLIWHRLGDVGYFDDQHRFWYCGRKSHRVETAEGTLFTIPVEAVINSHPKVLRSALVGVGDPGRKLPVVWFEFDEDDSEADEDKIQQELLEMSQNHPLTKTLKVFFAHEKYPGFPTDVRHNSKINRELLAQIATEWEPHHMYNISR